MRKSIAATAVAASLLAGGGIGLTLFGPSAVGAKSSPATTTTTPGKGSANGTAPAPAMRRGDFGGRHGRGEASVAAKAIGISETDLTTALRSGKTIAQVAKAHGVTAQKVINALVADAKTKLAAAVKAGRLTQTQADKLQTQLTQRVTDRVNGTFRDGPGRGFGGPFPGKGFGGPFPGKGFGGRHGLGEASVAAKAIGISETDLTTALRSGKTIAQVAKAHGVTAQKVINALVADAKTKLAAAVKAGRLTQTQADKLQTQLTQRVTDRVNGTFRGGPDGPHGGRGFGPPHN